MGEEGIDGAAKELGDRFLGGKPLEEERSNGLSYELWTR